MAGIGHSSENGKGLQTAVNAYLIQRGNHLTLVDTGTAGCFGPGLGQVLGNLRKAGYDPAEVDDVLVVTGDLVKTSGAHEIVVHVVEHGRAPRDPSECCHDPADRHVPRGRPCYARR